MNHVTDTSRKIRALVYGDVSMNVIDGSAVWAQGAVQVLAAAGCDVTFVLKAAVKTTRLLDPLFSTSGVTIRRPFEERPIRIKDKRIEEMSPEHATKMIRELDNAQRFDLFVVRGLQLVNALVSDGSFHGRLWPYLTDIPQSVAGFTAHRQSDLVEIAKASRYLLCQTEELRAFLESFSPDVCGRSIIFPPLVPEPDFDLPVQQDAPGLPLKFVYMGKFAPDWNTLEMTRLPAALAERGVDLQVHMIGDKIHRAPENRAFAGLMQAALTEASGVVWHGGMARQEAWRLAAGCDIGLSWRKESLDESLELSTKLLEYGRLGLAVIVNRTPMHETLLGEDYPLFANGHDIVDVIANASTDVSIRQLAAKRCATAAQAHSLSHVVERMRSFLVGTFPSASQGLSRRRPLRLLVASHDLKFFSRLQDYLSALPDVDLRVDQWSALDKHDEAQSRELNDWADVVICEWCGPNAAWYSKHKRPEQRLIVRLHRFELFGRYPARVSIENVDQVVCVSPSYATMTRERTGWPANKIVTIPNWVDIDQLDRPKLAGSEHTLGFIGLAPMTRKRFDRALDVLAELRSRDERFQLAVKTKMPWDYPWIWADPAEREMTSVALERIQQDRLLQHAVVFDSFGNDVANWLRRVGFVLSTSDDESFHLAPAEGMASRAVPVVYNWPGADTIYGSHWIHSSAQEMADSIYDVVHLGQWSGMGMRAQDEARSSFALPMVTRQWAAILHENLQPSFRSSTPEKANAHESA